MASHVVAVATATHRGRRSQNEDSVVAFDLGKGRIALAVADGMGGHRAGDVASQVATSTFRTSLEANRATEDGEALRAAFEAAAHAVAAETMRANQDDMGTTFVAAISGKLGIEVLNVGDSPGFLVLPDRMIELTEAHTAANEAILAGHITKEEAETSPYRHAVSRSLGAEVPEPATRHLSFGDLPDAGGAVLLLGSDGVLNHVSEVEIRAALTGAPTLEQAAQLLLKCAVENGSTDNVTVGLLELQRWPRHPTMPAPTSPHRRALLAGGLVACLVLVSAALAGSVWLLNRPKPRPAPKAGSVRAPEVRDVAAKGEASPDAMTTEPLAPPSAPLKRPGERLAEVKGQEGVPDRSGESKGRKLGRSDVSSAGQEPSAGEPRERRSAETASADLAIKPESGSIAVENAKEERPSEGEPRSPEVGGAAARSKAEMPALTPKRVDPSVPAATKEPSIEGPAPAKGAALEPADGPVSSGRLFLKISECSRDLERPPTSQVDSSEIEKLLDQRKLMLKADPMWVTFGENRRAHEAILSGTRQSLKNQQRALTELLDKHFEPALDRKGRAAQVKCKVSIGTR